jgi:hypothetical protein
LRQAEQVVTVPLTQVEHPGIAKTQVVQVPVFAFKNVPAVVQTQMPLDLVNPEAQVAQLSGVPLQEVHPPTQGSHLVKPPQLPLLGTAKNPLLQVLQVAE